MWRRAGDPVLRVFTRTARSGRSLAALDRPVRRPVGHPCSPAAVLQHDRAAFDRPGTDDPDAAHRLLLRHPFGASALRGSASEPCLSLVLPTWAGRHGARPLDVFEEPSWPLPRKRSAAPAVRDDSAALHG